MSAMIGNPLLLSPEGYQISRSVRLRSSASAYFSRTPASAGNRKTWTWSGWVKRGVLTSNQVLMSSDVGTVNATWAEFGFDSSDRLYLSFYTGTRYTTPIYRDPSAWYHVAVAFDTTQSAEVDRLKFYVNGVQQTQTGDAGFPALNTDYGINNNQIHDIGRRNWASGVGRYLDGYLTEVNFIDGQALTPSSFGEFDTITGVWKPKKYAGTYGTNGFYLNFSDNSAATAAAIGKDYSGNGNNWTPNNISLTAGVTYDSMIDVPTMWADGGNGRGNYAVANPLFKAATMFIDNGNLRLQPIGAGTGAGWRSNFPMPQSVGKWYYEVTIEAIGSGATLNHIAIGDQYYALDLSSGSFYYYRSDGNIQGASGYAGFANGSVIGVALDADVGSLSFYHNGVFQRTISVSISTDWWPGGLIPSAGGPIVHVNFGQRPFAYTPPTGFKALNTQNLPEPLIKKGSSYFDATLWTGNGTARSITNTAGFAPDLVWIKSRNYNFSNYLFDTQRGAVQAIYSNLTNAETTEAGSLTAFNSNGFSLGTNGAVNDSTIPTNFVGWQWKKGAVPGFDIVTGTSTGTTGTMTLAHSLGVAPAMVIAKNRDLADNWYSWHQGLGASSGGYRVQLNQTNAVTTSAGIWGTGHTSSNALFGQTSFFSAAGQRLVAYLFAEVPGFSKFGSYTGNGSADGPFVFCGFRPRYIMVKRTDSAGNFWTIKDTARNTSNVVNLQLYPNTSDAEATAASDVTDVVSNGFKLRGPSSDVNASGGTYIFAAFAENPMKYALAR